MSVKISSWVWDGCAANGVKGVKLLIMVRLADFSNDDGISWYGIDTIARQIGAARSTVITAIGELARDGWLTRKERRNGARNATNIYTLNVAKLKSSAAAAERHSPDSERSESEHSKSERSESERSENTKNGDFHRPESGPDPSVNSKQDPSDKKPSCPDASPPDDENPDEFISRHQDAVVCSPKKRQWGSQEDLTCAQWIWGRVIRLYEQAAGDDGEVVRPKEPNWAAWANEVRLMCCQDGRTHRQICELFGRANRDRFWCRNILSPGKLREKWDELSLKLSPQSAGQPQGGRGELDFDNTDWIYGIEGDLQRLQKRGGL